MSEDLKYLVMLEHEHEPIKKRKPANKNNQRKKRQSISTNEPFFWYKGASMNSTKQAARKKKVRNIVTLPTIPEADEIGIVDVTPLKIVGRRSVERRVQNLKQKGRLLHVLINLSSSSSDAMVPFNSFQGPDDTLASNLTMNLEKMNGCGTAKIRSSPEKLPPESNALGEDDIDGVENSENNEITDDESSVDLAPPDSPAGSLITDSGEESAGDDNENFSKQPIGNLNGSPENCSDPFYQIYGGQLDGPRGRRPLRGINESPQNKESMFIISNSKTINQWWIKLTHCLEIEKGIKIIKKFQDIICINKTVMAAFVSSIILVYIFYNFVRPVNESSLKSIHHLREEILNQYPAQDKQDLKNFIRTINNVNLGKHEIDQVAVVTILYSHKETAECLAKTAANYAVKVINRNVDYVRLNGSWNNANFYLGNGDFKKDIEGKGVLVVYDFHNFPAEKVRYFHGICDKHTPYIEDKAVYIILLEITKKQEQISKKREKVQSRIEELWSSLKPEILNPLATRLMDNVVEVRQEPELFFC